MIDFALRADSVAPTLLGALVTHAGVTVRVTEVEAYLGSEDAASHAFRGLTPRTRAMFGPPGRWYVYLSYGIHFAGNLSCAEDGVGQAVLLRAGEVVEGEPLARERRVARTGRDPNSLAAADLARGPGNLGQALGLTLETNGEPAQIRAGASAADIRTGPRIGISKNIEAPLRFWLPGDATVSGTRRQNA